MSVPRFICQISDMKRRHSWQETSQSWFKIRLLTRVVMAQQWLALADQ